MGTCHNMKATKGSPEMTNLDLGFITLDHLKDNEDGLGLGKWCKSLLPAPPKRCQYDPKGWLMGTPAPIHLAPLRCSREGFVTNQPCYYFVAKITLRPIWVGSFFSREFATYTLGKNMNPCKTIPRNDFLGVQHCFFVLVYTLGNFLKKYSKLHYDSGGLCCFLFERILKCRRHPRPVLFLRRFELILVLWKLGKSTCEHQQLHPAKTKMEPQKWKFGLDDFPP